MTTTTRNGIITSAVAIFAAALVALCASTPAQAAAGFGARPAHGNASYVTASVATGRARDSAIVLSSTSRTPLHLDLYPVAGLTSPNSGSVYATRERGVSGAGRWLRLSATHVTLLPGRSLTVPFTIRVPGSAAAGDHLAGVAIEPRGSRVSHGNVSVESVFREVVGVLVQVPGPASFQPALSSIGLAPVPGTQTAAVTLGLRNVGLALGKPLLRVSLTGPGGYRQTIERRLDTILPGDAIDYRLPWPDGLSSGTYSAVATVSGGGSVSTVRGTVSLGATVRGPAVPIVHSAYRAPRTGIPWWVLAVAAVVTAVGCLLVLTLLLYVRRRRWPKARPLSRRVRIAGGLAVATLALSAALFGASESFAAGSLTGMSIGLSSGVAGASNVTYTFGFTTATGENLTAVTMTLPSGTTGTPTLGAVSGVPGGGTVSRSGSTLTYTFPYAYLNAGTNVSIAVGALTNTSTLGSYTSTITTTGPQWESYPTIDSGTTGSFAISGGTLSSLGWSLSKSASGATGAAYTYTFTTATTANLSSVTMTVPSGTAGTPAVGTVSGVPSGGSVSLASNTLTYSFSSTSVAAGTAVSIQLTGLTNTSSAGSYVSQVATLSSSTVVDAAATPSITITSGALGSPLWTVSSSSASATGVAYTYTFTTATGANLTAISMSVPAGTTGTPTVGPISSTGSSLPANGSVSLTGTTLTYSFASTFINPNYSISIEIDGLKNTSTTGSYSSQITTSGANAVDSGVTAAISITGGSLTSPLWSVSNAGNGATGVAYTYSFTTATNATLSSVTMTVPPGTAGTPAVGTVTGVPSGGSVSLASNTLTYTFSSTSVVKNTAVSIRITGLTNTATSGSYTAQLTTFASGAPIDTGLTAAVSIAGGTLATPIWTASSSTSGRTNVTYTYTFTTGSGATLTNVTMAVPPGTAGTPTVSSVSGMPTGGTVALASNTLTYTFGSQFVNAGTAVSIAIGGLTNTTSVGAYTAQLATKNGLTPVDTGVTGAVAISGGALSNVGWAVSNAASGATAVTYTYTFTTASSGNLTSVSMSVPPGTAGTPTLGTMTGLPASGSVSLTSNTLTFTFASTSVPSGTAVTVRVNGLTNTTTTGSYTSQVATASSSPVDTGTSGAVSIAGSSLTNAIWTASATGAGATGVTYTYSFTTGSGANLTGFSMSVPAGTTGTPTVSSVTSTGNMVPTTGTVALASNTLTYSFATFVNPGIAVTIAIGGMKNTLTPGSYTSNISSKSSTGPVDTGVTGPISITGGTLGSPIWTPSSFATGAAATTYAYTFTAASSSLLDSVTMSVPPGTSGTPTLESTTGVPTGGTVTLAANTLKYTFTATQVNVGASVEIDVNGLTNTSTTGSYTSQLSTYHGTSPIDSGVTAAVSFTGGALGSPTWTPSSYVVGASSSYTYTFTTGSGATLNAITMSVPPGTAGTPTVTSVSSTQNAVPTNGTIALASNTLTYSFASTFVNAAYSVTLQIGGLTNTTTPGSYSSQLATKNTTTPVDTGSSPSVTLANGNPFAALVVNTSAGNAMSLHAGSTDIGSTTSLGTAPKAIAFGADGTKAYVVDSSANTITALTLATGTAGTPVALSGCTSPKAIAVVPSGATAYVACSGNAKVVPVTLPGLAVGSAISVGTTPAGIAVSPDGATVYAVASGSGNLTPIAVSTNTAGSAISLSGCTTPQGIAVLPSGATAYVTCSGNAKVLPVTLPGGSLGSTISVGTTPGAITVTPDGSKLYVANSGAATVTPITVSSGSAGSAIAVGTTPRGIAISPDGSIAYVSNGGAATVSQLRLSDNTVTATISVGSGPTGIAFAPDQAPQASLTVTPGAAGASTSFDASASTVAYGTITSYVWTFGDGATTTTSSPTVSHTYAVGCNYTATLTETDSAGTSTSRVFTGQQLARNGTSSAHVTATFGVTRSLGFATTPGNISFSAALNGTAQTISSSLPLDIGAGTTTSGWSISGTSTTFATAGISPHLLPTTATSVKTAPTVACDGSVSCTSATNSIVYPFVLPAATAAPTSARLFNAAANTGVCDQTVTPTFTLTVPATSYAGTYSSTWTLTLSSGP